jgi:RHS repeat-associated protein
MLLADEQVTSVSSNGNTLWPLADHQGTIRDIADYNEGSPAFSVTNHRVYDRFGRLESETNSSVDLSFGYVGKLYDEVTKVNYYLNRWYDHRIGKWLSEDPLGFAAGDANLARYVGNTSSMLTDPLGLAAFGSDGSANVTSESMLQQEEEPSDAQGPTEEDVENEAQDMVDILMMTYIGRKAVRRVIETDTEVVFCEYVLVQVRTRASDEHPWGEWQLEEWGAITERRGGGRRNRILIPIDAPPLLKALYFVHEATHTDGGDETAAYYEEGLFILDVPKAAEYRPGLVIETDNGERAISRQKIGELTGQYKAKDEISPIKEYVRYKGSKGVVHIYGDEWPLVLKKFLE